MKGTVWLASFASLIIPLTLVAQQPDTARKADTTTPPVSVTAYVTTSYTYDTHPLGDTIIVGRAYNRYNNNFSFNVANLTIERVAPTDRFSAGFHAEGWVGLNAAVVQSVGLKLGQDATV
jgi:hypothetical protein